MTNGSFETEVLVDDLLINPLGIAADALCQGVERSIFCVHRGQLYKKPIDKNFFEFETEIDASECGNILAFDHAGHLYDCGYDNGTMKVSRNYGKSFSTCLKDPANYGFRGFAIDKSGRIYVGSYGQEGPRLFGEVTMTEANGLQYGNLTAVISTMSPLIQQMAGCT